jgi:hypothetical protein
VRSYGDSLREPLHLSFFRRSLAARAAARRVSEGEDPVHEYLIDQANLRGYLGAYSNRDDRGDVDPTLGIEEIIVGLLQPHAPAEPRVIKLVVRALQTERVNVERLLFLSRRERALPVLAWIARLVPDQERTRPIRDLLDRLREHPPRGSKEPDINYSPDRLVRS